MHRTTPVPRRTWWSLLFSLLLLATTSRVASAQEPPPPGAEAAGQVSVISVPINTTKRIEMSNKEIIKEVRNENPKVVRVQSIVDDPRAVLVTGLGVGTSRLTFIDVNKKVENLDVRVPDQSGAELDARRAKLLEVIHATVPTAVVDAVVTDPNYVVLTGTVPSAEAVQTILETARGLMGGPGARIYNAMRVGGVQQVQLEVVVALVNRSRLRQLSTNFGYFTNRFYLTNVLGTASGGGLATTGNLTQLFNPSQAPGLGNTSTLTSTLSSSPNANFGVIGQRTALLGFLEALNVEALAKVLAKPTVVTLSGRPAAITSGGQTPILTSGGIGAPSVSYKDFGTVVFFLPVVLGNGKIHLEVAAELSSIDTSAGITVPGTVTTSVPGFTVRRVQDAVQIEDGQTFAIGGLIQTKTNGVINRVPVLGDIPFVNVLFSKKSFKDEDEELLILVTPRLVDPLCCTQIPQFLPGRETRSPDDFELFLEGIMEAPRGPRHVSPLHYQGAHMNSPNAGQYPCAGGYLGLGCANGQCATPAAGAGAFPGFAYPGVAASSTPTGTSTAGAAPTHQGSITTTAQPTAIPGGLATEAKVEQTNATALPPVRSLAPTGTLIAPPSGREPENRPVLPPPSYGNGSIE